MKDFSFNHLCNRAVVSILSLRIHKTSDEFFRQFLIEEVQCSQSFTNKIIQAEKSDTPCTPKQSWSTTAVRASLFFSVAYITNYCNLCIYVIKQSRKNVFKQDVCKNENPLPEI